VVPQRSPRKNSRRRRRRREKGWGRPIFQLPCEELLPPDTGFFHDPEDQNGTEMVPSAEETSSEPHPGELGTEGLAGRNRHPQNVPRKLVRPGKDPVLGLFRAPIDIKGPKNHD
jgi:hypothetical protein